MTWHYVMDVDDLSEGSTAAARLDGRDICLVRIGGELHAFDDACPHRQWPLHQGQLKGSVLTCRAHTWEWDVRSGELQRMRAPECLTMHEVRQSEGGIEVRVNPNARAAQKLSPLWRRREAPTGNR